MAAVTICSDFGAPKNKVWHCFHCFYKGYHSVFFLHLTCPSMGLPIAGSHLSRGRVIFHCICMYYLFCMRSSAFWSLLFNTLSMLVNSFSSKEQVSFNFMAAITICSDFGAPKNKTKACNLRCLSFIKSCLMKSARVTASSHIFIAHENYQWIGLWILSG